MTRKTDDREVIPAGWQDDWPGWHHLKPLIRFLIEERGHLIIHPDEKWGVVSRPGGMQCSLTRMITDEDWAALNERFVIPDNIGFGAGYIRDSENSFDITGHNWLQGVDGPERIERTEAELRASGRGGCPE